MIWSLILIRYIIIVTRIVLKHSDHVLINIEHTQTVHLCYLHGCWSSIAWYNIYRYYLVIHPFGSFQSPAIAASKYVEPTLIGLIIIRCMMKVQTSPNMDTSYLIIDIDWHKDRLIKVFAVRLLLQCNSSLKFRSLTIILSQQWICGYIYIATELGTNIFIVFKY